MTNHVLTPFSRFGNLPELLPMLKAQGVQWHLLLDDPVPFEPPEDLMQPWIHLHPLPSPIEGFFIGHWLVNCFLNTQPVHDGDRYAVLTDDDFYPPEFWRKVNELHGDIVVVSMQRSSNPTVGDGGHPFDTLLADPANMKTGSVGLEQIIFKGSVLKNCRLEGHYTADGTLIEKLWHDRMEQFVFAPDILVYFNYLEPGRSQCGRWAT